MIAVHPHLPVSPAANSLLSPLLSGVAVPSDTKLVRLADNGGSVVPQFLRTGDHIVGKENTARSTRMQVEKMKMLKFYLQQAFIRCYETTALCSEQDARPPTPLRTFFAPEVKKLLTAEIARMPKVRWRRTLGAGKTPGRLAAPGVGMLSGA